MLGGLERDAVEELTDSGRVLAAVRGDFRKTTYSSSVRPLVSTMKRKRQIPVTTRMHV